MTTKIKPTHLKKNRRNYLLLLGEQFIGTVFNITKNVHTTFAEHTRESVFRTL